MKKLLKIISVFVVIFAITSANITTAFAEETVNNPPTEESSNTSAPAENPDTSNTEESTDTSAPAENPDTSTTEESTDTSAPAENPDTSNTEEPVETTTPGKILFSYTDYGYDPTPSNDLFKVETPDVGSEYDLQISIPTGFIFYDSDVYVYGLTSADILSDSSDYEVISSTGIRIIDIKKSLKIKVPANSIEVTISVQGRPLVKYANASSHFYKDSTKIGEEKRPIYSTPLRNPTRTYKAGDLISINRPSSYPGYKLDSIYACINYYSSTHGLLDTTEFTIDSNTTSIQTQLLGDEYTSFNYAKLYIQYNYVNESSYTPETPDTPSDEIPSDDTPSDEIPSDDTPSDETPSDETPSDDTPSNDTPSNDTPSIYTPSIDTPSNDTPSNDTPSNDTENAVIIEEDVPLSDLPADDASNEEPQIKDNKKDISLILVDSDSISEDTDIVSIVDEDVPLGNLPKSGGLQAGNIAIAGLFFLLFGFVLTFKRKERYN